MSRVSLADQTTQALVEQIVSGRFSTDGPLPSETALAEQFQVSRLTVREAVKVLESQNILYRVHGRGTYVNPSSRWTSLSSLVSLHAGDRIQVMSDLIEVRGMIEVGAAELFAAQGDPAVLPLLREDIEVMASSHAEGNVEAFVEADMRFHNRILEGCGNPYVPATFAPISDALWDARLRTSSVGLIREHAIVEHARIASALESGAVREASDAMRAHLTQTRHDARTFLRET